MLALNPEPMLSVTVPASLTIGPPLVPPVRLEPEALAVNDPALKFAESCEQVALRE